MLVALFANLQGTAHQNHQKLSHKLQVLKHSHALLQRKPLAQAGWMESCNRMCGDEVTCKCHLPGEVVGGFWSKYSQLLYNSTCSYKMQFSYIKRYCTQKRRAAELTIAVSLKWTNCLQELH